MRRFLIIYFEFFLLILGNPKSAAHSNSGQFKTPHALIFFMMKTFQRGLISLILFSNLFFANEVFSQKLNDYSYKGTFQPSTNQVTTEMQFNGYTNYWHDIFREDITYGNLYKIAIPNRDYTIAQNKVDIAEDMGIAGLAVQEGFLSELFKGPCLLLDQPTPQKLTESIVGNNVLVLVDPDSEVGKKLTGKITKIDQWKGKLKSHQFGSKGFTEVNAFYLEKGARKIFVVSSTSKELRISVSKLIENSKDLLARFDLHRGWFGTGSLLKSVTITPGHPLEIIGKGMNEGNTWFTFSGYMDFLAKKEIETWLAKVNLPIVTDVGSNIGYVKNIGAQAIYGCKSYDGLQPQNMYTLDSWLNFAQKNEGYSFRSPYDPEADRYQYNGYLAGEGNKEQVDNENIPFVTATGYLEDDAVPCMVLFSPKGEQFTKKVMWESILDRREVAVTGNGKMMGPALYRNVLEMLVLDRVFLEEYFGDRINLEATTINDQLNIVVTNTYSHTVSGKLEIVLPPELKMTGSLSSQVRLPAGESKTLQFELLPLSTAMGNTNPIAVHFNWETGKKSTLTMIDLPPAISAHQLLYGNSPVVSFPVTIHNFTDKSTFPVTVDVLDKNNSDKIVFSDTKTCNADKSKFKEMLFDLKVPAGSYQVRISALGVENLSQLGVGKAEGAPKLTVVDLNGDGINEYQLENDSVRVVLLATGGRVIEYFVKSRNDNVLFKLWPEKPADDKREFRKRGYYPFGGFEDFLGQGSMEGHKVYAAEIIKKEGDWVSVRMTADYFGNKLEKTFTLYGNSPLLEVRYAMTFKNPEAKVIAPVPILVLGKSHDTRDIFTVPENDGLKEYHMKPEFYFGKVIFPREGWDSGYDPKEDIAFVGAFPVTRPLFLHMFQNLATNGDAHYDFNEFQPWVPIAQKTTSYFTYYLWGAGGKWQNSLKELRDRNLITVH